MHPLQVAALGYLLIALRVGVGGVDLTADPVGWALVLLGVARLPGDLPGRPGVVLATAVAAVVSLPLSWPGVTDRLVADQDALAWAFSLPALAAAALLAHALTGAARAGGDPAAAGWLASVRLVTIVVAALPAVVLGAGVGALAGPTATLALVAAVGLVVVLLVYAGRPWAAAGPSVVRE